MNGLHTLLAGEGRRMRAGWVLLALLVACGSTIAPVNPHDLPMPQPDPAGTTTACDRQGSSGRRESCAPAICVPRTCAQAGKNCGQLDDGCGGELDCGSCGAGSTCGGDGVPNLCSCVPKTCAAFANACGSFEDGCGATLRCGCAENQTCGGSGTAGICGTPDYGQWQPSCTPDGVCQVHPQRLGTLSGTWGRSVDDLWVVSARGDVAHWNGTAFQSRHLSSSLSAIAGTSPEDLWAVGAGVFHWNGVRWSKAMENVHPWNAVHIDEAGEPWLAGDDGWVAVRAKDGWHVSSTGTTEKLESIWAFSGDDVWVGGTRGMALHFDGSSWTKVPFAADGELRALWASADGTLWGAGTSAGAGALFRVDSSGVSTTERLGLSLNALYGDGTTLFLGDVGGVWVGQPGDFWFERGGEDPIGGLFGAGRQVWAVGSEVLHRTGSGWFSVDPAAEAAFTSVWARSDDEVHLADSGGQPWVASGGLLTRTAGVDPVNTVFGASPDDWWELGRSRAVHHLSTASETTTRTVAMPVNVGFSELRGDATNDLWAVGTGSSAPGGFLYHFAGSSPERFDPVALPKGVYPTDVWSFGPEDVWVNGGCAPWHLDAQGWTQTPLVDDGSCPYALTNFWGASPTDLWASQDGGIWHFDGTTWSEAWSGDVNLLAVWGAGGEVYAVGDRGTLLMGDAQHGFRALQTGTDELLFAVHATPSSLWIAGAHGVLLRKPLTPSSP